MMRHFDINLCATVQWRRAGLRLALVCVALTLLVCSVSAAPTVLTPGQYRERLRGVMTPLGTLVEIYDQLTAIEQNKTNVTEEAWRSLTRRLGEAETSAMRATQLLDASEARVSWGEEILEVDNEWLKAALADYLRSSSEGTATNRTRAESVRAILARLRGLDERLAEAEQAEAGAARDKEAEKGRLAAILRGPEFNKEAARGGALSEMIEQFKQWISDLMPEFRPWRPSASPGLSRAAQILIFALAAAVIFFFVWRYRRKHGGRIKGFSLKEARVVLGEQLAPDQTASDLLADAERLARAGDLRGAIRKAYVALLVELGDRKVIRLAQHKTNRDYLQAVRNAASAPQLYQQMRPLTVNFERHWYGFEHATESDWDNFRQRCRQILNFKL
ncbi:MAG TPA: DUF4129 domain-containing protein [Pyrinomonadaceae bacterium]|nr:DUF4129 domain-containing protein [Pyrinomonadaceae bacterium]